MVWSCTLSPVQGLLFTINYSCLKHLLNKLTENIQTAFEIDHNKHIVPLEICWGLNFVRKCAGV